MKKQKKVILGVTGSIAAVKTPELVRLLIEEKWEVQCLLTPSAEKFVTPLSLATFSKKPVLSEMFDESAYAMPHLSLAKEADLLLIAPATATILGELANGLAQDLISLVYLTTQAPTLVAPAMHDTMWLHPATQENVAQLKKRKVQFVGPVKGKLANEDNAVGRMADPAEIIDVIRQLFNKEH